MKMTKKLTPRKLIAIPVVVLVAAAAFALPASAATPERYVTVNAEGIVQVTPDAVRINCLLYTSPSPRDGLLSRMPSSA